MARGKKKETILTPEEKLQQALVPESEWPYKVSGNWLWVYIGAISNLYTGNSINEKKKKKKYCDQSEGLLYIATKDISFDGTINYETNVRINDYEKFKIAPSNTPLLCIEGGSAGRKIGFVNQRVCFVNKLCAFVSEKTNPKFIYYYLQSQCFLDQFNARKHGLIGGVSVNELSAIPITLPPFPEQQRIVGRIESLFEKLDEAREKAQAVVDGYEDRKAAILHKAFTGGYSRTSGEYSAKSNLKEVYQIRESLIASKSIQRPKTKELLPNEYFKSFPSHWEQVRLGSVAFVTKLAGFEYTKYIHLETVGDVPVIRAQNVRSGYLDTTNLLYIDKETSDLLHRSALDKPSILITFIGAGIGDVCVFNEKRRFHLAPNVAKVEPFCDKNNSQINIRFILHYLMSYYGQHEIFKHMKATAQPSLSMETIRNIIMPFPDIEEQNRIVSVLDCLIDKEQQAKESAEQVITQIDTMKKSILARAFRGELGTNDPSDESAEELLKQIQLCV